MIPATNKPLSNYLITVLNKTKYNKVFYQAITCAMLMVCTESYAQKGYYKFQEKKGIAYQSLENAIYIPRYQLIQDDTYQDVVLESFSCYGVTMVPKAGVAFRIADMINLRFDNDTSIIIIDGAFTAIDSIDATSKMSYKVDELNNEKIVKVEWNNYRIRSGPAGNFMSMQIWYYTNSGMFEMRYGKSSDNNKAAYTTSNGPYMGIFYSDQKFTKCYDKLWVTGYTDKYVLDSVNNFNFRGMRGVPEEGTVYQFIPKSLFSGVSHLDKSGVEYALYPNPVIAMLNFGNTLAAGTDIFIYNAIGEIVMTKKLTMASDSIDLSMFPTGTYFIQVNNSIQKLLKQ